MESTRLSLAVITAAWLAATVRTQAEAHSLAAEGGKTDEFREAGGWARRGLKPWSSLKAALRAAGWRSDPR